MASKTISPICFTWLQALGLGPTADKSCRWATLQSTPHRRHAGTEDLVCRTPGQQMPSTQWLPLTQWLGLALPGSQADAAEPNSPARPLRAASTEVAEQRCGPAIGRHSVSNLYGRVLCAVACARIPLAQGWGRRSTRVLPAGAAQWRHARGKSRIAGAASHKAALSSGAGGLSFSDVGVGPLQFEGVPCRSSTVCRGDHVYVSEGPIFMEYNCPRSCMSWGLAPECQQRRCGGVAA